MTQSLIARNIDKLESRIVLTAPPSQLRLMA